MRAEYTVFFFVSFNRIGGCFRAHSRHSAIPLGTLNTHQKNGRWICTQRPFLSRVRRVYARLGAPAYRSGTINNATMLMILINGLIAGPAVSLYGSPTVSPVMAAL